MDDLPLVLSRDDVDGVASLMLLGPVAAAEAAIFALNEPLTRNLNTH